MKTLEIIQDLSKVALVLGENGYKFTGIQYLYVSCSGHQTYHEFRGIQFKYDKGQMEERAKGNSPEMDTFVYYNNKCFLLIR